MDPGTQVYLRSDPSRGGVLVGRTRHFAGREQQLVREPSGVPRWVYSENLAPARLYRPVEDLVRAGEWTGPKALRRMITRLRVSGSLASVMYSMETLVADFYPHQFRPVLKLLESPNNGILIADEVGLGKTIEALLIWTELQARVGATRLLVLCPKSLRVKWKREIEHRCGERALILEDARALRELLERTRRRSSFLAIGHFDALKPTGAWRPERHGPSGGPRDQLADFLAELAQYADEPAVDLVVIDEAHHLRNPSTLNHKLGELVTAVADYKVLLSATPVQMASDDLHSLLRLLDPATFELRDVVDDMLAANSPIVRIRDVLLDVDKPLGALESLLEQAKSRDSLRESRTLDAVAQALAGGPIGFRDRVRLGRQVDNANLLAAYVTRTRRRHVGAHRSVRKAVARSLPMSEDERRLYDAVWLCAAEWAAHRGVPPGFVVSTVTRVAASSAAAAALYWSGWNPDAYGVVDEDSDASIEVKPDLHGRLLGVLRDLMSRLALTETLQANDTKLEELLAVLARTFTKDPDTKVVVFSSYRITQRYLSRRLTERRMRHLVVHGALQEPVSDVVERFHDDPALRVLLATRTGSEGLDLQNASVVVNYDLPWNPMEVEQRIGRIDRLGQKAPELPIISLLHEGTVEQKIYDRLFQRLHLIEGAIGSFEAILEDPTSRIARLVLADLAGTGMGVDDGLQVMADEYQDHEREALRHEAGDLDRHADFLFHEIIEQHEHRLWMTPGELADYVRSVLAEHYSGCRIEPVAGDSSRFDIRLTPEAEDALREHLATHPAGGSWRGGERRPVFTRSRTVPRAAGRPRSTTRPRGEQLTRGHPLVSFAYTLDDVADREEGSLPYALRLDVAGLPDGLDSGIYLLGIALWSSGEESSGRVRTDLIVAGGLWGGALIPGPDASRLLQIALANGAPLGTPSLDAEGLARWWTETLEPALCVASDDYERADRAKREDRLRIQEAAVRRRSQRRLSDLRDREILEKKSARGLLRAIQGRIVAEEQRRDRRLERIERQRRVSGSPQDLACVLVEAT